jgi:hypothetical protein
MSQNQSSSRNAQGSTPNLKSVCMGCVKSFSLNPDPSQNMMLCSETYPHVSGYLCQGCENRFRANPETPEFLRARQILNGLSLQRIVSMLEDNPTEKYRAELKEDIANFSILNRRPPLAPLDRTTVALFLSTNLPYPVWVTLFKRRANDQVNVGGQA